MSDQDISQYYGLLHHSLGIRHHDTPKPYRNYFEASSCHSDLAGLQALSDAGLMKEINSPSFASADSILFVCTEQGIARAINTRPKPPKLTRGKKRYKQYLECESDQSFIEWLKDPYWNSLRVS